MVKCNKGSIEIIGNGAVIASELTCLLKEFARSTEEEIGKEEAEKMFDEIVAIAKSKAFSDEDNEVVDEFTKKLGELTEEVLKRLLGGM